MKILVADARQIIFAGVTRGAVLPAQGGQVCVLDDHQSALLVLREGDVHILSEKKSSTPSGLNSEPLKVIKIKKGLAKIWRNELVLMVQSF